MTLQILVKFANKMILCEYKISVGVDLIIFSHMDNLTLITCGWVNSYWRKLSLKQQVIFERFLPWLHPIKDKYHNCNPTLMEVIWKMTLFMRSKEPPIYKKKYSYLVSFVCNADKRLGFYPPDRHERYSERYSFVNKRFRNYVYCREAGRMLNFYDEKKDKIIRYCKFHDVWFSCEQRWFVLFPNEMQIFEFMEI